MKKSTRTAVLLVAIAALVAMTAGCASSSSDNSSTSAPTTVAAVAPDYASPSNWLALPQTITKQVDVFYLSDTTYSKATPNSPDIGPIDDSKMQQGAKAKFTTTAAVFATMANIYAPYNRQVDSQYKSSLPIPQQLSLEAGIPTSDAVSAFDYYIKNMNEGRPFILAGHSQGSDLLANLLSGYMKQHPDVYKRMIAAYVIGFSITGDYLAQNPQLKFATGPDDTGVIISYNTEAPVMKVTNPVTMPGGVAINPITWTNSETLVPAAQSLGGIEVDAQTGEAVVDASGNPVKVQHYADAQVNKQRGVVICSSADPNQLAPGNSAVAAGIYHGFDYAFYFFDIRANAENRVARYLQAQVSKEVPDYADPANWLSLPATATKDVDVFFLYPTIYQQSSPSDPMVCAVDNSQMLSGAPASFSRTATVFSSLANIYAPYYRQAAIQVLTLPLDQQQQIVGGEPTADALSAFDYYIKNLNQGRPFILAGHSQGSNIMINLMADYMKKNPEVYKRMIAAYVPGYSITPAYLAQNPELKFATGADDTQVIVSYNTVSPTLKEPDPVVLPGALGINPITWTRDQTVATAAQNLGGIALDSAGNAVLDAQGEPQKVLGYADAQIDTAKGVLICSTADPGTLASGNAMVTAGIYHNYDYPFYFFDLRANAENRVANYLNKGYALVTLPQAGYQPIYDFIAGAKETIDMTMYQLADPAAQAALKAAATRGVTVRVLLDSDPEGGGGKKVNQVAYDDLAANGVSVRWAWTGTLWHQKSIVRDGDAAVVMTCNLYAPYYPVVRDYAVITHNIATALGMAATFDNDWNNTNSSPTEGEAPAGSELVWSPGAESALVDLIDSARPGTILYAEDEQLDSQPIEQAFIAAVQRGVTVNLTMTYSSSYVSGFNTLAAGGVHVSLYQPTAAIYIHSKAISVNNDTVYVGSCNFTTAMTDENRNVGIITRDPEVVRGITSTMAGDFAGATPYVASP